MLLIIGITGASGAIYGIRLLEVLAANKEVETHLIISPAGEEIIRHETDWTLEQVRALADFCYDIDDIGSRLSSGSVKRYGMVIAPCSMKTLSALANSYADNLIARSADIALKERKRLVLLARETPLHLGYLRNQKIQDLIDYTTGRILDIFDIEHDLFTRWPGLGSEDK